jgi:hypothetical protein
MTGTHPNPEDICVSIDGFAYEGGRPATTGARKGLERGKGRASVKKVKERH